MNFLNNTTISLQQSKEDLLSWLTPRIHPFILFPLALSFGIPFNLISIITIVKSSLFNNVMFRYILAISISDLLMLVAYCSKGALLLFAGDVTSHIYMWVYCKFGVYLLITFSQISSYCLVALTVDRYFCLAFPTKSKALSNLSICNRVIATVFVTIMGVNIFSPIIHDLALKVPPIRFECIPINLDARKFFYETYLTIQNILYSLIPGILMGIFNILMLNKLKNHKKELSKISNSEADDKNNLTTKKLTKLIIFITTTFILFTMPVCILSIYVRLTGSEFYANKVNKLLLEILTALNSLNHSINFLLYCLFGKKFVSKLSKIFSCNVCINKREQNQNINKTKN